MTPNAAESPLLRMTRETPTEYWNDSCDPAELAYAIERGATGATSNPGIVLDVLKADRAAWTVRIRELAAANPAWSEVELSWAIAGEMAVRGAGLLRPVFEATGGRRGRQSIQVNPAAYRDTGAMVAQALHLHGLAPNLHIKFPATEAGIAAIEEATAQGVNTNATVSFTVAQAVAAIDPAAPNWAGIAVLKRTYALFRERSYRSRLLSAAYRHPLHWTELVGGDLAMTLTYPWQVRFNASGIVPEPRIDQPVDRAILDVLLRLDEFRCAYEPDGLSPAEFDGYGSTVRTLRAFIGSYHDLQAAVRDAMLPDPDVVRR